MHKTHPWRHNPLGIISTTPLPIGPESRPPGQASSPREKHCIFLPRLSQGAAFPNCLSFGSRLLSQKWRKYLAYLLSQDRPYTSGGGMKSSSPEQKLVSLDTAVNIIEDRLELRQSLGQTLWSRAQPIPLPWNPPTLPQWYRKTGWQWRSGCNRAAAKQVMIIVTPSAFGLLKS